MRLVRYADDFVVLVHGARAGAEALFGEVAAVLEPVGLRLSEEKTHLTHIDDGFDFLGWRIQRRTWQGRGGIKRTVYTYPSKKSLASIKAKIRLLTRRAAHRTLADPLIAGSTRRSEAGAPTSATAFRRGPSATSTTTPSGGSSAG
jgi:RNA-directed DNA polymerase